MNVIKLICGWVREGKLEANYDWSATPADKLEEAKTKSREASAARIAAALGELSKVLENGQTEKLSIRSKILKTASGGEVTGYYGNLRIGAKIGAKDAHTLATPLRHADHKLMMAGLALAAVSGITIDHILVDVS